MKTNAIAGMVLLIVLIFSSTPSAAFECNGRIISLGDMKAEVLMKCGEPVLKDTREENSIERIDVNTLQKRTVIIDEWTYNLGPASFIRYLRFENGKLVDIRTGDYGY